MTDRCRFEPDAIRSASTGAWTESLRAHVATCADCAAAVEAGPWMEDFARLDDRRRVLPDPAVLWLKAKLMQSSAAAERAALPITRVQIAAYLVVAAGWAALLTWKWSALRAWVNTFTPGEMIMASVGAHATARLSPTFFAVIIVLGSATVALAMHTILADE
jgi:hypothetical protein